MKFETTRKFCKLKNFNIVVGMFGYADRWDWEITGNKTSHWYGGGRENTCKLAEKAAIKFFEKNKKSLNEQRLINESSTQIFRR